MRSKLGTKSRLAAHIIAFVLLIFMLVFIAVPPQKDPLLLPSPTIARTAAARAPANDRVPAQRPDRSGSPRGGRNNPGPRPTARQNAASITERREETPAAASDEREETPENVEGKTEVRENSSADPMETPDEPSAIQPDESGAMVLAASGPEEAQAALEPMPQTGLEVLGDGVYWLGPTQNLEKELATIPEIKTLVLLTPTPAFRLPGLESVNTEYISADMADLSFDSAARFAHLTNGSAAPVVAAVAPGSRGAGFFKGVYLLANRELGIDETLLEIEPELKIAGGAGEEIVHRLRRLDPETLR